MTPAAGRRVRAVGAGVVWAVCWLPWAPAWAFPLAFVLLLAALRRAESARQAVAVGTVYAFVAYGIAGHFLFALTRFSPAAAAFFFVMVGYFLPFSIALTWGAWRIERATGLPRTAAFPLLYVVLEGARATTDLSFPADLLAHAFGDVPAWMAPASALGTHGQTVWILAVAGLLETAWTRRSSGGRTPIALALAGVALWLAPIGFATLVRSHAVRQPPRLSVGIVQPSVAVTEKFDPSKHAAIWQRLVDLSRRVAPRADVVLWPESARPRPVRWDDLGPFRDPMMERLARELDTPVLYGCEIARFHGDEFVALYNGAAIAYPDGRAGDWYGKQRLLPLAEGIPFGEVFGWDPFGGGGGGDGSGGVLTMLGKFTPGPRPTVFEIGEARIGVLICYEGMYPALAARYLRRGANVLAVITNDLWWGESVFPRWHDLQAGTVARTYRVPVVRAANAGYSGAYDGHGRSLARTDLFDVTATLVAVPLTGAGAPGAVVGTRLPWLALIVLGVLAVGSRARRRAGA